MLPLMPRLSDVLAAAVRAERARRRWTQADLAARLGWSTSTVGDIESGKRRVASDDLPALCRAFDLPLAELVRGADDDDHTAMRL
jgi:transcriptional regulator with XRE-family HTH domain